MTAWETFLMCSGAIALSAIAILVVMGVFTWTVEFIDDVHAHKDWLHWKSRFEKLELENAELKSKLVSSHDEEKRP